MVNTPTRDFIAMVGLPNSHSNPSLYSKDKSISQSSYHVCSG